MPWRTSALSEGSYGIGDALGGGVGGQQGGSRSDSPLEPPPPPHRLLLQAGYDPDVRDKDGWTPLHAAAHWGVEEACRLLAEHLCDMAPRNNVVGAGGARGCRWGAS